MKSVAIITIQTVNYGNRLQNYALQETIKQLGFNVESLRRVPRSRMKDLVKLFCQFLTQSKGYKFHKYEQLIKKSEFVASVDTIPEECVLHYDYFVAGSDQIWNPYYLFVGKTDLLYGVPRKKSVAYAASFGVPEVTGNQTDTYVEGLKEIGYISVREQEAVDIVKQLIGKAPYLVLDPTLLIEANQWKVLSKKPLFFHGDYVLVYVLGNCTETMHKFTDRFRKNGIRIVDINKKNIIGHDKAVGPKEFLWLINNAHYIITDSFHGTVFSVLFHKKFQLLNRDDDLDMSSRLSSLLRGIGIVDDDWNISDNTCFEHIDYANVDRQIKEMKEESLAFLKMALNC